MMVASAHRAAGTSAESELRMITEILGTLKLECGPGNQQGGYNFAKRVTLADVNS